MNAYEVFAVLKDVREYFKFYLDPETRKRTFGNSRKVPPTKEVGVWIEDYICDRASETFKGFPDA
jgi:hypothetical protein